MKNLFIASALNVLIVFIVTFLVITIDSIGNDMGHIVISLTISALAAAVAFVVLLFWAIPLHLILKRLNYSNPIWYILLALIPSFMFIYAFKPFGIDSNIDLLQQALFCSFVGSLSAIIFWYFAVYKEIKV